jgi:alpha-beta hydrolase superfamily lysophospholipase
MLPLIIRILQSNISFKSAGNIVIMKRNTILKRICWLAAATFILLNLVAFFHAYQFTHFSDDLTSKTKSPEKLSTAAKIKTLFLGVKNPRPFNTIYPSVSYETVQIKGEHNLECWYLPVENSKGSIVVFHGYSGNKSGMIGQAELFVSMGYNVLLVDFMGSGGSAGYRTSIGYHEAGQVKQAYDFLVAKGESEIFLFGTSMGAVAILKCLADFKIEPTGIIIECPFGSMYETTCARFRIMKVPVIPMAGLLVFWGGIQNGFWAFDHNPTEYAKAVKCPVLLLYGEKDKNVSRAEIDQIYKNIEGDKTLKLYPDAGHENYLLKYKSQWVNDIQSFLMIFKKN